jgi:hypothetical protein
VEVIIFGGLQHTKYLELGSSGLAYSLMFVQRSELVIKVRNSQENNCSNIFL